MDYTIKEIVDFLRSVNVMSASVIGERGPISTILLFHVSDDLKNIFFATHKDSFKAQALTTDPRISMSVWSFKKMLVQMDGLAVPLMDEDQKDTTLDNLTSSVCRLKDFWPPILQIDGEGYTIFKVSLNWVRVLDLSCETIHANSNLFKEINI